MHLLNDFEIIEDLFTEEQLKEQIEQGLFKYRRESYILRNLQMQAIDYPKTFIKPQIPKNLKFQKPRYLCYLKNNIDYHRTKYVDNAMNLNARRVKDTLLSKVKINKSIGDNKKLLNQYCVDRAFISENEAAYEECKKLVRDLYDDRTNKEDSINMTYKSNKEALEQSEDWVTLVEGLYKNKQYDLLLLKLEIAQAADVIIGDYDYRIISSALVNAECSEAFIFNYFFKAVAKVIAERSLVVPQYKYIEDENGDIEYLHKRYTRLEREHKCSNIEVLHNKTREELKKKIIKQSDKFTAEVRINFSQSKKFNQDNLNEIEGQKIEIRTQIHENKLQPVLYLKDDYIGFIYSENGYRIDDYRTILDFENREVEVSRILVKPTYATLNIAC
jgi:hypothetical protein